jgi:hypothetical protein
MTIDHYLADADSVVHDSYIAVSRIIIEHLAGFGGKGRRPRLLPISDDIGSFPNPGDYVIPRIGRNKVRRPPGPRSASCTQRDWLRVRRLGWSRDLRFHFLARVLPSARAGSLFCLGRQKHAHVSKQPVDSIRLLTGQ